MIKFRIVKFLFSGGLATLVHSVGMYALLALALEPHLAFLGGFTIGVAARFLVDRNIVFEATDGSWLAQLPRYAIACALSYLVSAILFYIFLDLAELHIALAFILSVAGTTVFAYAALGFALTGLRRSVRKPELDADNTPCAADNSGLASSRTLDLAANERPGLERRSA